jgi:glycosyltransferase involved in cell wall biosynthesis
LKRRINSNVAVIIPTLNEEKGVGLILRKLIDVLGNPVLLMIDGNSVDETVKIAKYFGAEVIFQNGRGKGAALRQAFNYEELDGDLIIIIDADGSMDPKEVPMFIEAMELGADVVKGSRFLLNGYSEDMDLIRKIGNKIMLSIVNFIWSTSYTDLCYGFMAFKRESLKKLSPRLNSTNFEIEAEICIKAKKLGLKVVEVPSVELRRCYGRSNLKTFRDGFLILLRILREVF